MKTNQLAHPLAAAIIFAVLSTASRAETPTRPVSPPTSARLTITVTPPANQPTAFRPMVTPAGYGFASVSWPDIKELSFAQRDKFVAGCVWLETQVAAQVSELADKPASLKDATGTKDWDFAMKEMMDAQAYLRAARDGSKKAGPETWNQQKDKVGEAWARTQDAYGKAKSKHDQLNASLVAINPR